MGHRFTGIFTGLLALVVLSPKLTLADKRELLSVLAAGWRTADGTEVRSTWAMWRTFVENCAELVMPVAAGMRLQLHGRYASAAPYLLEMYGEAFAETFCRTQKMGGTTGRPRLVGVGGALVTCCAAAFTDALRRIVPEPERAAKRTAERTDVYPPAKARRRG